MIGKLRRRLTAVFTALTALVLAAALTVTFFLAWAQYQDGQQALFDTALGNVLDKLTQGGTVSDVWLARQEAAAGSLLYISDNGAPLHFSGGWSPATPRQTLFDAALAQAEQAGVVFRQGFSGEAAFSLAGGGGERYRAAVRCLPFLTSTNAQKFVGVVMLQDLAPEQAHLYTMAAQYLLVWLAGAAVLAVIIWLLAGLALRPTQEALRRQTQFVAAASHELRSPLTVVKASLAAARQTGQPEKERSFLRTAEREADRMARLTDDLLLLAGGDAGAWQMRGAALAMDTFCIELYETFLPLAMERGHVLTLQLPDAALPTLRADAERLTQLFGILLSNAMEYAPAGTPIELLARADKKEAALTVADHGPGIADADKQAVFQRFYRTDQSRTDKAHFGLGLSVAQEIAAMHGAALVLTDTPGGGATFTLHLPL